MSQSNTFTLAMIAAKLGAVLLLLSGLEAGPDPKAAPAPAPAPAPEPQRGGSPPISPHAFPLYGGGGYGLPALADLYGAPAPVPQFMLAPPVNPPPFNPYPFSGGLDYSGLLSVAQNFMRAQGGCIHSCGWGKKK